MLTPTLRRAPTIRLSTKTDLTLAGFLTFSDPPLPDAAKALAELRKDGVEVKIITGDGDLVTAHVCSQVGVEAGKIVLGDELENDDRYRAGASR